jgi:tetratricopeptide (TPR) repeat protein
LVIFKRSYPQEQVKKIDKIVADLIAKESIEKKRQAQQLIAERQEKEKQAIEDSYDSAVQLADKYYKQADYENAKKEYNKALVIFKRSYPQDQLKKIDKIVADLIAKENIEKKRQAEQLIAERLEKEKQALEDRYDTAVQLADKYYKQGDYENAKKEYNKALGFIKKDFPRDQINEINKIIARQVAARELAEKQERQQQELKNRYNSAMDSADKLFDARDYANAKLEYNRANSFIPNSIPQEQIKKINKILTDQLIQSVSEKQRLTQETEITARYTALIKSADLEFKNGNFVKAKKLYADAVGLKPAEEYPKGRLLTIENNNNKIPSTPIVNNTIGDQDAEVNRKYNLALSNGKSSYQKNDLPNAKSYYEEAATLKPLEGEPKKQLDIINDQLAELARLEEIDKNYEDKIGLADSLLNEKAFDSALATYKQSSEMKPLESYPKLQIKYVQTEIIETERIRAIKQREEDATRYKNALASGEKAVAEKRFREAKMAYTEALSIHPQYEYGQSRLKIVSYQIERMRAEKLKQMPVVIVDSVPPVTKVKKRSRKDKVIPVIDTMAFQPNPIPYSNEELKSKYPTIDFSLFPPAQHFNKSGVYFKKNIQTRDTMVLEKPRLDSSAADQGIKLIGRGINFQDTIVFIKLLIRNYSKTDFLTGPMILTWAKNNGVLVKMEPYHLLPTSLPVIKPLHESFVTYVCKFNDILDEESLSFELTDRFNRIKLRLKIPGTIYNQEWAR